MFAIWRSSLALSRVSLVPLSASLSPFSKGIDLNGPTLSPSALGSCGIYQFLGIGSISLVGGISLWGIDLTGPPAPLGPSSDRARELADARSSSESWARAWRSGWAGACASSAPGRRSARRSWSSKRPKLTPRHVFFYFHLLKNIYIYIHISVVVLAQAILAQAQGILGESAQ